MSASILMPREAGKFIAEHSVDVKIDPIGIEKTVDMILKHTQVNGELLDVTRWNQHEMNPKRADQAAIDWIFFIDTLNFSFWVENDEDLAKKFRVTYAGKQWSGYWALCAAVNRAFEKKPITDPIYYSTISREELQEILTSDGGYVIPMLEERLKAIHEVGDILVSKYNGSFVNVVKKAEKSAQKLLQLVVEEFPVFRDESKYQGQKVAFYKRAQILIGDIWSCGNGFELGEFHDIDSLTIFADYRIPQMLVWPGEIKYSEQLQKRLEAKELFVYGEPQEVEIRGCTIHAIELVVERLKQRIEQDKHADAFRGLYISPITVDHFLWDYRHEHAAEMAHIPFHRVRCIYY